MQLYKFVYQPHVMEVVPVGPVQEMIQQNWQQVKR